MSDNDKKRYEELLIIINERRYSEIGSYNDSRIIKSTDLKEIIMNKLYNEPDLDIELFQLVDDLFTDGEIDHNDLRFKELMKKLALKEIDEGNYYEDMNTYYDGAFDYFCEKIKNPNYYIKSISVDLCENDKFIEYCLNCNNLSIFQHVKKIDNKYRSIIIEKIKNGAGFLYNELGSSDPEICFLLVKNGYIGNSCHDYIDNTYDKSRSKEIFNILKDRISKNEPIVVYDYVYSFLEEDHFNSLIDYILTTKKYEYLKEFLKSTLMSYVDGKVTGKLVKLLKKKPGIADYVDFSELTYSVDEWAYVCKNFYDRKDLKFFTKVFSKGIVDPVVTKYIIQLLRDGEKINLFYNPAFKHCLLNTYDYLLDTELLKLIADSIPDNIFEIINTINADYDKAKKIYNKNFYDTLKENIVNAYNVNIEHLDIFVKKFGYLTIYYLENENIISAINLDDESFNYYMSLFDQSPLNIQDVQNIYDSILQSRFKFECQNDISRFERIKEAIKNKQIPMEDLKVLASNFDIEKIRKMNILTEEQLLSFAQAPLEFLLQITSKLISDENVNYEEYISIIYCINHCYIANLREEYRATHSFLSEVRLDKNYDEKSLREAIFRKVFLNSSSYNQPRVGVFGLNPIEAVLDSINYNICDELPNKELVENVFQFLRTGGKECNTDVVIRNVRKVKKIFMYSDYVDRILENNAQHYYQEQGVKFDYVVPESDSSIFKILCEINTKELKESVIKNPVLRERLKKLLDKYKMPFWNNTFDEALRLSDLEFDISSIATLISKFSLIAELLDAQKEGSEEIPLIKFLTHSMALSSSSDRYSILFGLTDARLLKSNDTPNAAKMVRKERLEYAASCMLKMYNRKKISVPPIDKEISANNKRIKVTLGNFTSPINLTYGERTGSCMRIGGAGQTLFDFCMTDQDAFHICLEDPSTGEFISRVSGFRSGNSVFLNQLRESTNDKYSNDDIIEAIKIVTQILIDSTKDSKNKIENVFITDSYAFFGKENEVVEINENIGEGHNYFYFDLNKKCIVLNTTSKTDQYAPIILKPKADSYDVLRQKVKIITEKGEIYSRINNYLMLKAMVESDNANIFESIDLVSYEQANRILCLIAGEDFIVYINSDMEIKYDFIKRDDKRVEGEIRQAIGTLNKIKEEYLNETRRRNSVIV